MGNLEWVSEAASLLGGVQGNRQHRGALATHGGDRSRLTPRRGAGGEVCGVPGVRAGNLALLSGNSMCKHKKEFSTAREKDRIWTYGAEVGARQGRGRGGLGVPCPQE